MSNYMQKGSSSNSQNIASVSGLRRSVSLTPVRFRNNVQSPPGAPRKASSNGTGWNRAVERPPPIALPPPLERTSSVINTWKEPELSHTVNTWNGKIVGTMEKDCLTLRRMPAVGVPNGALQGLLRTDSTTRLKMSPRTEEGASALKALSQSDDESSLMMSIDGNGNVDKEELEKNLVDVKIQNMIWRSLKWSRDDNVSLLNVSTPDQQVRLRNTLGTDVFLGLDVKAICESPLFTVEDCIQLDGGSGYAYRLKWHRKPSVVLIVDAKVAEGRFHNAALEEIKDEMKGGYPVEWTNRSSQESSQEEKESEEVTGLNRSFTPNHNLLLPMPEVSQVYKRKARDGPQYAWVEHESNRTLRNEFMKQGHRVEVVSVFPDGTWPKLYFRSLDGGIVTQDMHQSGCVGDYFVSAEEFEKHMELVSEEELTKEKPSVEQTSGGSMSEKQSRSKLASLDALQRAQANATDTNNKSIPKKKGEKRKADLQDSTPPVEKKKVGRPKGSKKVTSEYIPFADVITNGKQKSSMQALRDQQEALLFLAQNPTRLARRNKRQRFTTDGTSTKYGVEGVLNKAGIISPISSPTKVQQTLVRSWSEISDIAGVDQPRCD